MAAKDTDSIAVETKDDSDKIQDAGHLSSLLYMLIVCLGQKPAPWGSRQCGNYKSVFTYQLMSIGGKKVNRALMTDLMGFMWSKRFIIRNESHGVPLPDNESSPNEYFDMDTLPVSWTTWLDVPDPISHDGPVATRDAQVTDGYVDLTRQSSRRQSPSLHKILDLAWSTMKTGKTPSEVESMEKMEAKGDVSKLQRLLSMAIDGFEDDEYQADAGMITQLRDFVLYFMHNPTSDSASSFNAYMKKRVIQWYNSPPGASISKMDPIGAAIVRSWNRLLVRTPAARTLTKLLETRRFYARSHTPMEISYNRISHICKLLFASDDIWQRAVAVMFAIGVRPNELFRSFVEFHRAPVDDGQHLYGEPYDPESWLTQVGCSKSSNASRLMTEKCDVVVESEKRTAVKPILFGLRANDVIECIHQLRLDANEEFKLSSISAGLSLDEAPTSAITLTVVQRLSRTMYIAFQKEGDECTRLGHLFGGLFSRKFYACASLYEFERAYFNRTTPNQFVSDILMHQPGMPTDSVHYVTLKLLYGERDTPVEEGLGIDNSDQVRKRRRGNDNDSGSDHDDDGAKQNKHARRKKKKARDDGQQAYWRTDEMVSLKTLGPEKKRIQAARFAHRKFINEDERQEYYSVVKQYLQDLNIKPSIANLTSIGISPQFQSARKRNLRTAMDTLHSIKEDLDAAELEASTLQQEVKQMEESMKGDESCDTDDTEDIPDPPALKRQKAQSGSPIKMPMCTV